MAPTSSTTSLLESLKVIEILKGLTLDQIRAVHGCSYPTLHSTFSVITSVIDYGTYPARDISYFAQAIVYTTPGSFAEWKLLDESAGHPSRQAAIEDLYSRMEMQAGEILRNMKRGDIWNEAEAREREAEREDDE